MIKDKRWMIQNDPGILRKKADAETDLFVFGYACKIFRDDQKALEMDQGKQLIPWMGDESLKIDRYDARGHLSELSQFEGTNQDYVLTSEERRIEQLCDEERYRALHHNEEEQEMYQEEELKRLKQALSSDKEYGQVAYQYDNDGAPPPKAEPEVNMEDEEPFVPSPALYIPANMKLPLSVKENQIIEKTAAHIASHGPQVEILIKTRQANNQKLNFLHVGSPLNPYYNFILSQIKTGRYKPQFMIQQEAESKQENEHYLHPSLAPAPSAVESAPSIPSIAYKPSSDCSYNLLVNKIRNMQQSRLEDEGHREEPSTSEDSQPSHRKRRKIHSVQSQPAVSAVRQVAVPPEHVKEIISRLINFAHSRDLHPSEIASNLLKQDSKNLGFVEPGHKYHEYYVKQLRETYKENIYNLSNPLMETTDNDELNRLDAHSTYDPARPTEEGLDHSASENSNPSSPLDSSEAVLSTVEKDNSVTSTEYDVPYQSASKPVAPVCFSIKKPKEAERLEVVSAFPLEETSSDEEGKENDKSVQPTKEDKEKSSKEIKSQTSTTTINSEELLISPKAKEHSMKNNNKSPGSLNASEVIVISSQSSESSRKSSSSDTSKKTTSSSENSSKKSIISIDSKKSTTSSDSSKKSITSADSGKKSTTSSDSSKKSTTSSDSGKKSITSTDSGKKSTTSIESSSKQNTTSEDRKSRERDRVKRSHRKHKYSSHSHSSPEKYMHRDRAKMKPLNEYSYIESLMRIRKDNDDLPPLPEDPLPSFPPDPEEDLEKKREERKKKVKQMIEKIKTESMGIREENSQGTLQVGSAFPSASSDGLINLSKSLISQGSPSSILNKSSSKSEENKSNSNKDPEEKRRQKVKQSLKKLAETSLVTIPPIAEDNEICSQYENSSAANSTNGFETPSSCGRPMYRVSRTPSIGLTENALQEPSSRSSSSTGASRKSHKKKKHHKKKKKRKGRSKTKKHHESSSESSSEDESSDEWGSSSDSDPSPKKRHKKSSKRSHKRHKRKHRRRHSSASSSSST